MKRDSNRERAVRLAEIGALRTRYVSEEGLEIYTGISAKTFTNKRGETPRQWTREQIEKAIANGEFIGPPFIEVGDKRIYDLWEVDKWMKFFRKSGLLPETLKEEMA
jgi:hypothetical protein